MVKVYDFMAYKKERDLVALEAECAELKSQRIIYVSNIINNDDGLNAQIEFELIPDDEI